MKAPSWTPPQGVTVRSGPTLDFCDVYAGWTLDVSDPPGDDAITLAPNETREIRIVATSRRHPACNPERSLAMCGERVSLLLAVEGDSVGQDAFATSYQCRWEVRQHGRLRRP